MQHSYKEYELQVKKEKEQLQEVYNGLIVCDFFTPNKYNKYVKRFHIIENSSVKIWI